MSQITIQENPTTLILSEVNNQLIIQEQNTSIVLQSVGTQGPQGPNVINGTTTTTFTGILKGNGATITTATPDVDYATVTLTIVNALIFG